MKLTCRTLNPQHIPHLPKGWQPSCYILGGISKDSSLGNRWVWEKISVVSDVKVGKNLQMKWLGCSPISLQENPPAHEPSVGRQSFPFASPLTTNRHSTITRCEESLKQERTRPKLKQANETEIRNLEYMKTMSERGKKFKKRKKTIMNHFKRERKDITFMKQEQETSQKWEHWNKLPVPTKAENQLRLLSPSPKINRENYLERFLKQRLLGSSPCRSASRMMLG